MKLMKFLSASLALACMTAMAMPAMALSAAPAEIAFESGFSIKATTPVNDCLASFDPAFNIVFVEADQNCDAVMAELTGLCLAPTADPLPPRIAAVLDPGLDLTCIPDIDTGPPA